MAPPPEGGDVIIWNQVATESGLRFPADYRDFVAVFGGGAVDDYLEIYTPPVPGSWRSGLLGWKKPLALDDDWHLRSLGRFVADPAHHEMFGFAANGDGDDAVWSCGSADPDEWKVLVGARHPENDSPWSFFDGGMADFLLALIRREIDAPFSRAGFPSSPPRYLGWREWQTALGATD
jgi:hypothetical protein